MAVSIFERPVNGFASKMVGLAKIDDTHFIHVFADWDGSSSGGRPTNVTLKGRIGTIDTTAVTLTFSAESDILTLPYLTANPSTAGWGQPGLCSIAVLSTTQAAIQWQDNYRSYYFTPLTFNLATGVITAGATQNTFGASAGEVPLLGAPTRFCRFDSTHYCAVVRHDGISNFGVMDASCVAVGSLLSINHGSQSDAVNVVPMDTARSQFLTMVIDRTGFATDDPYIDMVTPGTPPVRSNPGVKVHVGPDVLSHRVTGIVRLSDTHSFYVLTPTSSTMRLVTVAEDGTTNAITFAEDPLVIDLPSVTYETIFSTFNTVYPQHFDAIAADDTHILIVGELMYSPTPSDDNFGRFVMRTFYWELVFDGTNWSLLNPPEVLDLDSVATGQGIIRSIDSIAMSAGWTITAWDQNFNAPNDDPNRLAVFVLAGFTPPPPPPPPPPPAPTVVSNRVRSGTASPLTHTPRMADASKIISLRNTGGPIVVTPVPVVVAGIWRTSIIVPSNGFTRIVPHDRDSGLYLIGSGLDISAQAWSMVAHEPALVTSELVLPSSPNLATLADGYGIDLISMGDQSGVFLAYDRGQAGGGAPTTLYGQLIHYDGNTITLGPEFSWDAVAHDLYLPAGVFQQFSHQIVGLSATRAVRFWFAGSSSLAIRAELLDFAADTPVITDYGALGDEPIAGTTLPTLWAQRSEDGAAAVYWTEALAGPVAHLASFVVGPKWTRMAPDPLTTLSASGGLPYAYGNPISAGEAYFTGFHTTPFNPATSLDLIVHADAAGNIIESARRSQVDPVANDAETLTGLTDTIGTTPDMGGLSMVSATPALLLHLWARFSLLGDKTLDLGDPTINQYPGIPIDVSVLLYNARKLTSSSDVMFFATWTDDSGGSGSPNWYLNHARFGESPRQAVDVVSHQPRMRSKAGV